MGLPEGTPCGRGAQLWDFNAHTRPTALSWLSPPQNVSCAWRRQGDVAGSGCRAGARPSAQSARHAPSGTDLLRRSRGSWRGPKCQEGAPVPGPGGPSGGVCWRRGLEKDMESGILSSVSPPSGHLGHGQNEISRCAVAKKRAFFTFPCTLYLFPLFPPVLSFWAEKPVSTNLRTFGQSSVWHDTAVISYLVEGRD